MSKNTLELLVFFAGLAAVTWIGASYLGSNPLALAFTLLIGACYVAGALELRRFRQDTIALDHALTGLAAPPADLSHWLQPLPTGLRQPVRLRIEGERVALPGPALTPYLVGLLVLLGMLGTLLGMMVTLRGTGLALESATDLQAIRSSLAAPVQGLGFAFGTSIAGVAASAMLGLLSALSRRHRAQAVQRLDAGIATMLRIHSKAYQREESLRLLQRQADVLPGLVDRLQGMMVAVEQQGQATGERQLASQQAFQDRTEAAYRQLTAFVAQSLQESVAESTRATSAVLQPAMASVLDALARDTVRLHEGISGAVQQQLQALTGGFEASTAHMAGLWNQALEGQQQANQALTTDLRATLDQFANTFQHQATGLLDHIGGRLDTSASHMASAWDQALSRQDTQHQALAARNQQALDVATTAFAQQTLALLQDVNQSQAQLQSALASQDQQRLAAWNEALAATHATLREDWNQAGQQAMLQQQEICDTLARTADEITAQARAHANGTISEIARLVETASEAPRAAASVIAELRQQLSDSMVRDTAMLEERTRMMATLDTLLDAVGHASTEQRTAIDTLIGSSAELLQRVGSRFTDQVQAETGKLETANAQVTASAAEVASLGEAFGAAVQLFGDSSQALATRLQGIEEALARSLARSDEQLAYYVAQAREVIDLSMLSQRQILEEMRQVGATQASADAHTA